MKLVKISAMWCMSCIIINNLLDDVLSKYNEPIVMDLDIGHLPPMMPLVCGSVAEATVKDNSITVNMEYK